MNLGVKQKLFIAVILALQGATELFGCTIFSMSDSSTSLMGNSEDYTEDGYMAVKQEKRGEYGRIEFSFADGYVQGGINAFGLAIDATAAIKEMVMVRNSSLADLPLADNIIELMLKKCRDVDEAIKLCQKYNLLVLKYCHIMFADASGKSVIVSLDKDGYTQYLTKEGKFQLLTNFNPLNPSIGYYPCSRYDTASVILPNLPAKVWSAVEVLNAVNQGAQYSPYAHVYDCKNLTFHLFRKADYSQSLIFGVKELLAGEEKRVKIIDLPKLDKFIFPADNATLNAFETTISFQIEKGDYKFIMAKSEAFENPITQTIASSKVAQASLSLFLILFLLLCIPKTRFKILPIALLFMVVISCEDDSNPAQPIAMTDYQIQINQNESGKWYWKVEGVTDSGYRISTKPTSFIIE